jgi:hypothetical protein
MESSRLSREPGEALDEGTWTVEVSMPEGTGSAPSSSCHPDPPLKAATLSELLMISMGFSGSGTPT